MPDSSLGKNLLDWLTGILGAGVLEKPPIPTPSSMGVSRQALDGDPLPKRTLQSMKKDERWILSIDGGGIRGIFALRAIQEFQNLFEPKPDLTEIFDLFAGTSTGSIIAALLADGYSIDQVIELYTSPQNRSKIFDPNTKFQQANFGHAGKLDQALGAISTLNGALQLLALTFGLGALAVILTSAGTMSPWVYSIGLAISGALALLGGIGLIVQSAANDGISKAIITPWYRKGIRDILHSYFGDRQLHELKSDILITTRDTNQNATMFLSAFDPARIQSNASVPSGAKSNSTVRGTFRNIRIRDAVESSMSAPLFFSALDRFIDGGVGSFNNPAAAAAVEALRYSAPASVNPQGGLDYDPNQQLYNKGKVTVWSFGTAVALEAFSDADLRNQHDFQFWINNTISQTFQDANDQQHWIARDLLDHELQWIKYRRYQMYVSKNGLNDINFPSSDTDQLTAKNDTIQQLMQMDNVSGFDWLDRIATCWATFLGSENVHNWNFDSPIVEIGKPMASDMASYVSNNVLPSLNRIGLNDELGDS